MSPWGGGNWGDGIRDLLALFLQLLVSLSLSQNQKLENECLKDQSVICVRADLKGGEMDTG